MNRFDPFLAIQRQQDVREAEREVVEKAISLIDDDRPNAARRFLFSEILEGRAAQRIGIPEEFE